MYSNYVVSEVKVDQEWLSLIREAKKAGLTIEQIRDFLNKQDSHTYLQSQQG